MSANGRRNSLVEPKQEEQSVGHAVSGYSMKSFQGAQQKQQLQSSNYAAACQWAAQQSPHMVPQITSSPPPKEPIRPKGERIGADEIQVVQNHIEKCLQLYMNQNEVITALHLQANIEPGFTSLVWQRLEEQNPEFFRGYSVRLRIKEQITAFNYLASQQFQTLQKSNPNYFQIPQAATATVPGNFFRTDQPQQQTQQQQQRQGNPPTQQSSSSSQQQQQQPQQAQQQPHQQSQSQQSQQPQQQTQQSQQSQQQQQTTQQRQTQLQDNIKKEDFLDTNIFFEQPS